MENIFHIYMNRQGNFCLVYVLILLPIEMPVTIKEYISLQYTIEVWAGVAGLDRMRCEELKNITTRK